MTDKSGMEVLKEVELLKTAGQVAVAVRSGVRLIIVHGAGSFGHVQARRFQVKAGFFCEAGKDGHGQPHNDKIGFADTRRRSAMRACVCMMFTTQ